MVGEHRLDAQALRQSRYFVTGSAVQQDQAGAGPPGQGAQGLVELGQALHDEVDSPVLPGQRVEDVGVEHEHGVHLFALAQGLVQAGVVVGAQVAPEPEKTDRVRLGHRDR